MNKKSNRTLIIIAVTALVALILVAGTAVSVYAYLQLAGNETDVKEADTGAAVQQSESDNIPISEKGVLVTGVQPESPADQAGLRRGSIILEVEGEAVNTPQELREALGEHEAGESVTLTVLQCDEPVDIEVTLASSEPYLGVEVGGFSPSFMEGKTEMMPDFPGEFNFGPDADVIPGLPHNLDEMEEFFKSHPEYFEGMPHFFDHMPDNLDLSGSALVVDIVPDSPAAVAGLEKGDKIVTIDRHEVKSPDEVVQAISSYAPGDEVTLGIDRDGESMEIPVALGSQPEDEAQAYLGIYLGSGAFHHEFQQFEEQQNS